MLTIHKENIKNYDELRKISNENNCKVYCFYESFSIVFYSVLKNRYELIGSEAEISILKKKYIIRSLLLSGWAIPIGPVFCLMAVILNYNGGLDVTYMFRDGIKNDDEIKNSKKTEVAVAISLAAVMAIIAILVLWVFHGYGYF